MARLFNYLSVSIRLFTGTLLVGFLFGFSCFSQNHKHEETHGHGLRVLTNTVPAYITDEKKLQRLPKTMHPDALKGEEGNLPRTLEAYKVARKIPKILAQIPCYCYCDEIGHESLHSCFVSKHAAKCGKCLLEAILAFQLHKKGISTPEIRNRIIAKKGEEIPDFTIEGN
jgi:hypothetical protein